MSICHWIESWYNTPSATFIHKKQLPTIWWLLQLLSTFFWNIIKFSCFFHTHHTIKTMSHLCFSLQNVMRYNCVVWCWWPFLCVGWFVWTIIFAHWFVFLDSPDTNGHTDLLVSIQKSASPLHHGGQNVFQAEIQ